MTTKEQTSKTAAPAGLRFQDVQALMADPAPARRAKVAQQLGAEFDAGRLKPAELAIAIDIMRAMAADAETAVRHAVAESMKGSKAMPRDIALKLANDEATIALPILEWSPVLTDDDLVAVLADGNGAKQVAIARRPEVSTTVAAALIDTGNAAAVTTLVSNEGAALNEDLLKRTLDRYGKFETVKAAMVHRNTLPVTITERLVALVSDKLKVELASRHAMSADSAADIILEARERATIGLLSKSTPAQDSQALVAQLHARGRLTPSLVLRALCSGDIRFTEDAFAEISGLGSQKASLLIHDAGPLGLKSIYKKCEFPEQMYPAFRVAIDMIHETDLDGGAHDRERFARRLIERILTKYTDMETCDLDYLLAKLSRIEKAA